jgi:hypothetical protein
MNLEYKQKYLKYKRKYFELKKQIGGVAKLEVKRNQEIEIFNKEYNNKKKELEKEFYKMLNEGTSTFNSNDKNFWVGNQMNQVSLSDKQYKTKLRNINLKYNSEIKKQQQEKKPQQQEKKLQQPQKKSKPQQTSDIVQLGSTIRETQEQINYFTTKQLDIKSEIDRGITDNVENRRTINLKILPELEVDLKSLKELNIKLRDNIQKRTDNATGETKKKLVMEKAKAEAIIKKSLEHQEKLGNIDSLLAKKRLAKENEYKAKQKAEADRKHSEQLSAYKIKHKTIADNEYNTHIGTVNRCTDLTACEKEDLTVDCNPLNIFKCPISLCIMKNPVKAADGYLYEKTQIEKWFNNSFKKTPMGSKEISHEVSEVRKDVQEAIKQWKAAHIALAKMKKTLATATKSLVLKSVLGEKIDLTLVTTLFTYPNSGSFKGYYEASNHKAIINENYIIGDHNEDKKRVESLEKQFNDTKTKINRKYKELLAAEKAAEAKRKRAAAERRLATIRRQKEAEAERQREKEDDGPYYSQAYWDREERRRIEAIDRRNAQRNEDWAREQSYISGDADRYLSR